MKESKGRGNTPSPFESEELTPNEWAKWALLGDPYARVPLTLKEMISRVEWAIKKYKLNVG